MVKNAISKKTIGKPCSESEQGIGYRYECGIECSKWRYIMSKQEDENLIRMKLALADLTIDKANTLKAVRKKLSDIDDRIEFLKKKLMDKMCF